MGKLFALVLAILTLASVAVFFTHAWWMPVDISTDGPAIDRQIAETMLVSGILFVLAQALLGIFAWKFADVGDGRKVTILPGGAKPLVLLAIVVVGAEILALTLVGSKVWADIYMTPAPAGAVKIDVQAQQFAFHFRYAMVPTASSAQFIRRSWTIPPETFLVWTVRAIPRPRTTSWPVLS